MINYQLYFFGYHIKEISIKLLELWPSAKDSYGPRAIMSIYRKQDKAL